MITAGGGSFGVMTAAGHGAKVFLQTVVSRDRNNAQEATEMGQRWPIDVQEFSVEMTDLFAEAIEIALRNGLDGNELKDAVWRHVLVEGSRHFAKNRE
jgi:hypothetical protein